MRACEKLKVFFLKTELSQKNFWPPRSPDLTPADFFLWGPIEGQIVQSTPCTIEQLKDAIRQEIQAVKVLKLWEKVFQNMENAFECAWMRKETSFSIDCEQVLFCIVPSMCI